MGIDKQPSACLHSKNVSRNFNSCLPGLKLPHAQLQEGMFVVETKVNSLLVPYSLERSQCTLLENVARAVLQEGFAPTENCKCLTSMHVWSPKNLLKKWAPRWLRLDNKLCSVTPFIVTSISYHYKTGANQSFCWTCWIPEQRPFPHSALSSSSQWFRWHWLLPSSHPKLCVHSILHTKHVGHVSLLRC